MGFQAQAIMYNMIGLILEFKLPKVRFCQYFFIGKRKNIMMEEDRD